jgi:hypothetical protein
MYTITHDLSLEFEKKIKSIYDQLKNKGVSPTILDEVFSRVANEQNNSNSNILNEINLKKFPYNWEEKIVLIVDYSSKSHALFGNFDKSHINFKNDVLSKNNWLKFSQNLAFGAGYTIVKNKIDELRSFLEEYKIEYRELSFDEFKKEGINQDNTKNNTDSTHGTNSTHGTSIKDNIKKESIDNIKKESIDNINNEITINISPQKKNQKKITRNKWGNFENSDGFVVQKLFIEGRSEIIVIGKQNTNLDHDVKGIKSVVLLSEDLKHRAKKQYKYLDNEIIKKIKKTDKELAEELSSIPAEIICDEDNSTKESD